MGNSTLEPTSVHARDAESGNFTQGWEAPGGFNPGSEPGWSQTPAGPKIVEQSSREMQVLLSEIKSIAPSQTPAGAPPSPTCGKHPARHGAGSPLCQHPKGMRQQRLVFWAHHFRALTKGRSRSVSGWVLPVGGGSSGECPKEKDFRCPRKSLQSHCGPPLQKVIHIDGGKYKQSASLGLVSRS